MYIWIWLWFSACIYGLVHGYIILFFVYRCQNSRCIDPTSVCDFIDDCGDSSDEVLGGSCVDYIGCNFEDPKYDPCQFIQDKSGDNFDWTRNSGWTPSYNTGPTRDHTYGLSTGIYLNNIY